MTLFSKHPRFLLVFLAISSWFGGLSNASPEGNPWVNQFEIPPNRETLPAGVPPPNYSETGFHFLSVGSLMTDLGRQQVLELQELATSHGVGIDFYSMDRVAGEWPKQYLMDIRSQKGVSLPFRSIEDPGMAALFKGYDPDLMRVFPQTFIVDASRSIHRIFKGVQSRENLEDALEKARDPWSGIANRPETSNANLIQDPGFERHSEGGEKESWGVYLPESRTLQFAEHRGWKESPCLEIRSSTDEDYRIVYQIIPHQSLLGRTVRLSALSRSNCLGAPRATLAVPHPKIEEGYRFLPRSPIKTRSGVDIPFRIIGGLAFAPRGTAIGNNWKATSSFRRMHAL